MYKGFSISAVMPCLNEEAGIQVTIKNLPSYIDEIIVADNGSTDASAKVATALGAKVIHESRRGYGSAYKAGIPVASGDIIITMDADASYKAASIEALLIPLVNGKADFASGNRFPLKNKEAMPLINRIGNVFLTLCANLLFWGGMKDSQSGMWAFWKRTYKDIQPSSDGMAFSQEIKVNALLANRARFKEVAIHYAPRIGKTKIAWLRDGMKNLLSLVRIRFDKY